MIILYFAVEDLLEDIKQDYKERIMKFLQSHEGSSDSLMKCELYVLLVALNIEKSEAARLADDLMLKYRLYFSSIRHKVCREQGDKCNFSIRYPCIRFMIFLSDHTVVGWNEQIYKEIQSYIASLERNT